MGPWPGRVRRPIALLAAVLALAGLGAGGYLVFHAGTPPALAASEAALRGPLGNIIEEIAERGVAGVAARPRLPNARLPSNPEAELAQARRVQQLAEDAAQTRAARSARAAALIRLQAELRARLVRDIDDLHVQLAKDFACSLAWQNLSPDEKADEAAVTDEQSGTRERSYGTLFASQTLDALVDVAKKLAYNRAAQLLGGAAPALNEWDQWANDVVETATADFDGPPSALSQQINVNGYVLTRAAYYYARACLSPPRR